MPLDTPRHQRAHGRAELGFRHGPRGTTLGHLYHAAPYRILFPVPEPDDLPSAALVNVGGGLAGGDSLSLEVTLEAGATAQVTTPAAEKIYRSLGDATRIDSQLSLAPGATLEWLPQETILFDGARLERRMRVAMAPDSRLLATEMLVFGRAARGELFATGALFDSWRLHRGGRLDWADALDLSGAVPARLAARFGFGAANAMALLLFAAPAPEALAARDLLREAGLDATLARPGLLLARWLGEASALRQSLAEALPKIRASALGLPPRLPRLWTS
ncbi:urease accessory protein UreD [Roseomonas sp. 18066]|uniref:urease accessory protein UreD n=1 Tax=Roseomonas sp. 18066 TaxID=2681412 RepID=UPI001358B9B9|nr:urease accessory protein UreD [Roseomonas sp. 18066]